MHDEREHTGKRPRTLFAFWPLLFRCCIVFRHRRFPSESLPFLPQDDLSFLSLWTIPRHLFGVLSARESFHRDRRQVASGPSSLTVLLSSRSFPQAAPSSRSPYSVCFVTQNVWHMRSTSERLYFPTRLQSVLRHPRSPSWASLVPRRYFCVWRHPPVQQFQIARLRFV